MKIVNYKENPSIKKEIKSLYISAFPSEERPPVFYFFLMAEKPNVELYAFYDNNKFIGFTNLLYYEDICYIFFLAIAKKERNKGYGTQILNLIKEMNPNKVLIICFEEVDPKYIDFEIRKRRENFYLRNGFKPNDLKTCEYGVRYDTVYYGKHKIKFDDYLNIFLSTYGDRSKTYIKEAK